RKDDMPVLFITFEGMEGAGKTTHHKRLAEALTARGYNVLATREPGGCALSEEIRAVLLNPREGGMSARAEALLYAAARAELVETVIKPALAEGKIVLCDRYIDSSLAYQGFARGLGYEAVYNLNGWAAGLWPGLTFFFRISPEESQARQQKKHEEEQFADRLEQEPAAFHTGVFKAFKEIAAKNSKRFVMIDATKEKDEVAAEVLEIALRHIDISG
ncbi:MAG: dTMP kinase, partial [Clostridia bacterium]|nr:dTMP kinase [Clostridia bacterium]